MFAALVARRFSLFLRPFIMDSTSAPESSQTVAIMDSSDSAASVPSTASLSGAPVEVEGLEVETSTTAPSSEPSHDHVSGAVDMDMQPGSVAAPEASVVVSESEMTVAPTVSSESASSSSSSSSASSDSSSASSAPSSSSYADSTSSSSSSSSASSLLTSLVSYGDDDDDDDEDGDVNDDDVTGEDLDGIDPGE